MQSGYETYMNGLGSTLLTVLLSLKYQYEIEINLMLFCCLSSEEINK